MTAGGAAAKQYRVLFVDDSMAFLEMVTDLFGARENITWEILTATSPDKALAILQQKLVALIVLDIGMPLLDGIQLLGLIHQRYPNIKKVVLTGESDDRARAACLAAGAELFLLKPADEDGWRLILNLLTSLLRWEDSDDFVSTLSDNGLYNVIQLECLGGSSSVIEVRNQQTAGEIYIENGAIVHASGKLVGKKAFHQLLSLTDGEFRVIAFRAPAARTVKPPWDALLWNSHSRRKRETVRQRRRNHPDYKKTAGHPTSAMRSARARTRGARTAPQTCPDRTAPTQAGASQIGHERHHAGRNGGGGHHHIAQAGQ